MPYDVARKTDGHYAGTGHPGTIGLVELAGHAGVLVPQAPRQGCGGQAVRSTVLGQRVEERIGGGVVALPGAAEGASNGGEEHERGQLGVLGELMQVPGGVHFGTQHGAKAFRGQRGDDCTVQHTRGVHDRRQRVVFRD